VRSWGQQVPPPAVPAHEVAVVERAAAWVGMTGARVRLMGAPTCCASTRDGCHGEGGGTGGNNGYTVGVDRCCTLPVHKVAVVR
jgi:hypothetical protein